MVYLGDPPKRRRKRGGMIGVEETARRNKKSSPDKELEKLIRSAPSGLPAGPTQSPKAFKKDKDTPAAQTFTPLSYTKIKRDKRGRKRRTPRVT